MSTPAKPDNKLFGFNTNSIRFKLVLMNSLILAVILIALGFVLQYFVKASMLASVDRELYNRTQKLTEGPPPFQQNGPDDMPNRTPPPDRQDPLFGLQERIDKQRGRQFNEFFRPRIISITGQVILPADQTEPWDKDALKFVLNKKIFFSTVFPDGEPVRVLSQPLIKNGKIVAIAQSPYPLMEMYRALRDLNRVLLILIPIVLILAGLGGNLLTKRALTPVREITRTAENISEHDLKQRLTSEGDDEFAELAFTFNDMLDRLDSAFSAQKELIEKQKQFTADASHELRSPLTVIRANASLILHNKATLEDCIQAMNEIDTASLMMSKLVQDLLMLARADSDRLGQDKISVPVREIFERAVKTVTQTDVPKISIEMPDDEICFFGNEDELTRVFSNLLDNAVRYTSSEGKVVLSAEKQGDKIIAKVRDTGTGIAPEHLEHLGERFYRVDTSRARSEGGTGLGLSICRSIIKAHGGEIIFESETNVGTTVTVIL